MVFRAGPAKSLKRYFSQIFRFAHSFRFYLTMIFRLLALSVPLIMSQLPPAPVDSNIIASHRADTELVDMGYDVATLGVQWVSLNEEASSDGGVFWFVPIQAVTGDLWDAFSFATSSMLGLSGKSTHSTYES